MEEQDSDPEDLVPENEEDAEGQEASQDGVEGSEEDTADVTAPPVVEPDPIGLSCELKVLFATHCQACHGLDAKNGTPLLTREHLLAVSKKDPAASVVQRVLLRVAATEKPMPPMGKGTPLSETEIQLVKDWVAQGTPQGSCAAP